MPKEDNEILKHKHREKPLKAPLIIIADLECILPKTILCQNNPKESYTERKAKHKPSGYSWITCCSFDESKNEQSYYRGKVCIERFSKDLKNLAIKAINYEKKEVIPLTNDEKKFCEKQKVCYTCKKEFYTDKNDEKEFKLKQKGEVKCSGENTEKYMTFSVAIKKELDNDITILYKLKFIDSYRFMSTSLSDLTGNLSEINKKERKACMERKNIKSECKFIEFKNNRLNYKRKECGKRCFK